jgi:hypothetical protein
MSGSFVFHDSVVMNVCFFFKPWTRPRLQDEDGANLILREHVDIPWLLSDDVETPAKYSALEINRFPSQ